LAVALEEEGRGRIGRPKQTPGVWRGSRSRRGPANTIGPRWQSVEDGSANRAGYGFLRVEGLKDSVFIPPPEMRGVMTVTALRVRLSRGGLASDRWSGAVERWSDGSEPPS